MLNAQTIQYNNKTLGVNNLWDVAIENETLKVVYLKGSIVSRETGVVYEAQTNHFQLPSGSQIIKPYLFNKINVLQSTIENLDLPLQPGSYVFKTIVIDYYSSGELAFVTEDILIDDIELKELENAKENKKFTFNLNSTITSQYAYDFNTDYTSNDFTRFTANPSITLFDIPVSASINVTTENKETVDNINFYNVHFDYYKFQQIMLEKAMNKVNENPDLASKKELLEKLQTSAKEQIASYDKWKAKLEDPNLKEILKSLEDLDALKNVVESKELKEKYSQVQKIEKLIKGSSLEDLKKPLKYLEQTGISRQKLEEIFSDTKTLELIHKSEAIIPQLNDLKSLDDPQQFLALIDEVDFEKIEKLSSVSKDNIKRGESLSKLNSKEALINLAKNKGQKKLDRIGSKSKRKAISIVEAKDVTSAKILKNLSQQEISKYAELAKKYKSEGFESLSELGKENIETLLKNFNMKQLDQVKNLYSSGINQLDKLRNIGSWKDVEQLINFKGEYGALKERYENLLKSKKQYKTALKIKREIDAIEDLSIKSLIKDPKSIKSAIENYDISTASIKLFSQFKVLELGNFYPLYNTLMLKGIDVKGGNIEYAPGKFYLGFAAGKVDNQIFGLNDSTTTIENIKRNIYAVKVGLGDKFKSHIHINYLSGYDNNKTDLSEQSESSNHVLGLDFAYQLKQFIKIEGEVNASLFNPNRNLENEVKKSLQQKGYAYNLKASYITKEFELYTKVEQISSLYRTFGLPYLINDRLSFEGGLSKKLLENKLQMNAYYRRDLNGGNVANGGVTNSGNLNIVYVPSKLPFVNVFYNLLFLDAEQNDGSYSKNIAHNISVTSGYSWKLKQTNFSSQVAYSYQDVNNQSLAMIQTGVVDVAYDRFYTQQAHIINLSQQVQINKYSISAIGIVNKYNVQEGSNNGNLYSIQGTLGVPLFKNKLRTITGVQYSKQGTSYKMGFLSQLVFSVTKYINFNLNLKYEQINSVVENNQRIDRGLLFNGRLNFRF